MFEISEETINEYSADKKAYYSTLAGQLKALLADDTYWITNQAQTAAFIYQMLPDLNWAGFYQVNPAKAQSLILGPYQGKVACVHIPFGRGVCGVAAQSQNTQMVADVHQFTGHIACDAASQSELVIPIMLEDQLFGVLDIDSPIVNRFDEVDISGMTELLAVMVAATDFPSV